MFGIDPEQLRREWLEGNNPEMGRRREIILLATLGAAVLTVGTLRQVGILKRLPDLGCARCAANQVSTSDAAYSLGAPDAPVAAASYMANAALAAFGPADRAETMPLAPIAATVKAGVDVAGAAAYLREMVRQKNWCVYCLASAAAGIGVLALTIPEALRAIRRLAKGWNDGQNAGSNHRSQ